MVTYTMYVYSLKHSLFHSRGAQTMGIYNAILRQRKMALTAIAILVASGELFSARGQENVTDAQATQLLERHAARVLSGRPRLSILVLNSKRAGLSRPKSDGVDSPTKQRAGHSGL